MALRASRFPNLASASEALAEQVATCLRERLMGQPRASLALPGGSTPGLFLRALGAIPLDWDRITVLPGDERFVAITDPASNEGQIRALFPPVRNGCCAMVSLRGESASPDVAAEMASMRIASILPLDIAVFGMGEDGHIASLFPGEAAADWQRADEASVISTSAPDGSRRLSVSPGAILAAGARFLLISGRRKCEVLALAANPGPIEELPVRLLLTSETSIIIASESDSADANRP